MRFRMSETRNCAPGRPPKQASNNPGLVPANNAPSERDRESVVLQLCVLLATVVKEKERRRREDEPLG